MASEPSSLAPTALIVGCGYLGQRLVRLLLARGVAVLGTTRSPSKAATLAAMGVRPLLVDVTQRLTLAALTPAANAPSIDLFFLIPPGRANADPSPRQVLIDGMRHVLGALDAAKIRRAVFSSSTAVYGHGGHARVDADTPALPGDPRAQLLLQAEHQWLSHGPAFHIARLAGLYGPGRVIGLRALRDGSPIVGDPQAVLNMLHVDDAATLLLAMLVAPSPERIELGCDDCPPARVTYYRHLAGRLGLPEPQTLDDQAAARLGLSVERLRRSATKVCDNAPTRRRTGWAPAYPDFVAGLAAVLGDSSAHLGK